MKINKSLDGYKELIFHNSQHPQMLALLSNTIPRSAYVLCFVSRFKQRVRFAIAKCDLTHLGLVKICKPSYRSNDGYSSRIGEGHLPFLLGCSARKEYLFM